MGLPDYVFNGGKFVPIEDFMLAVLRPAFPFGVSVQSLIADNQTWPLVLVRRDSDGGGFVGHGNPFLLDVAKVHVHCYCDGLDADSDAASLAEYARLALIAAIGQVVSDGGPANGHYLTDVQTFQPPRRETDFATSSGPVQYADLPSGVVRYEAVYEIAIRVPRTN